MYEFNNVVADLARAETALEVISTVQRFVTGLSNEQQQELPCGLRARPISNVGDVAFWTLHLNRDALRADEEYTGAAAYGITATIFKRASARLVELRSLQRDQST